jgi:transcriptional regulator with XRE-family HTH domain
MSTLVNPEDNWVWLDGKAVRRLREAKGLRQSDITEALAGLGIAYGFSQTRLSHIETGRDGGTSRGVTPAEATALAAVLGKSVWAILAKDPAEDPRIGQARKLTDELAEQNAELIARLARTLAGDSPRPAEAAPIALVPLMSQEA